MTVPVQVTAYCLANSCITSATTINIPVIRRGQRYKEAELTDLRHLHRELSVANGTYPTAKQYYVYCDTIEGLEKAFYFNLKPLPAGNIYYLYVTFLAQVPLGPLESHFSLCILVLVNARAKRRAALC